MHSSTHRAVGQRATMTQPGSRTVSYTYDTAGRVASLTDWQARATSFGYDADGRRTTITRPGVTTTNVYDLAGRLASTTHTGSGRTLQSFAYTYDLAGNRTLAISGAGAETYALDALGRLMSLTYAWGRRHQHHVDTPNQLPQTTKVPIRLPALRSVARTFSDKAESWFGEVASHGKLTA